LHNLNAFAANGLVMRYGYMMEHTIVKHTYSHVGPSGITGKPDMTVPPLVLVTETKKRIGANPFGFGVDWNGLSSFQLSIAAALGLSRSS
jgi:predicted RNA methylase